MIHQQALRGHIAHLLLGLHLLLHLLFHLRPQLLFHLRTGFLLRLFANLAGALARVTPGQLVERRLLFRRELVQTRRAALLGRKLLPKTRLRRPDRCHSRRQ